MKKLSLSILGLLLTAAVPSCTGDITPSLETTQNKPVNLEEQKVIATFESFIEHLNGDPATRSTTMDAARVTSVRKTSTSAYGGGPKTRAEEGGMPVWELTLTNPDNTTGFAVVADPETVDEVIAYAPLGSLADTVFNKGLAIYFRNLAALANAVSRRNATRVRNEWPQEGWEDFFNEQITPYEFFRWLTPQEMAEHENDYYSWYFHDPVSSYDHVYRTAYVPTEWHQGNPYNNRVPYKIPFTNTNSYIGCYTIAVGQIMAFHKYPRTYNWNLILGPTPHALNSTVPPTPTNSNGIILSQETPQQKEVSRLLYDVAVAGNTDYVSYPGGGATFPLTPQSGLPAMGYTIDHTDMDTSTVSAASLIKQEIETYRRPVLFIASGQLLNTGQHTGHAWVVDAICIRERWDYLAFKAYGYSEVPYGWQGLDRSRKRGLMMHCNWGWGGQGDGWFYSFIAPHSDGLIDFYYGKHLFYNIKPI